MGELREEKTTTEPMKDPLIRTFRAGRGTKRLVARIPTDLVGVAGFVAVAAVLLTVVEVGSVAVRAAVGFPLLFLAPGYALVSVLFPRSTPLEATGSTALIGQTRDLTDTERVALAFGLSFALLPLLALAMAALSMPFTVTNVVSAVSAVVLIGLVVAAVRRFRVPASDRYRFRLGRKLGAVYAAIFGARTTFGTVANVVLAVSVLVALTTVGYALVAPQQGEQYTDLRLLSEDESGDLVAADYPDEIEAGESIPLTLGIENREGRDEEYTVVVQEQRLDDGEVVERTTLERSDYRVADGATEHAELSVTPNAESGSVRIAVLLYDDAVADTPTTDNAYRYTYVWVDVTDDAGDE